MYRRFYPTEQRIPKINGNDGLTYTHVQLNRTQDLIIETIENNPGLTQKEIAKIIGKSTQVINYNISAMAQLGLIKLHRDGNKTKCFVNGIYRVLD